MDFQEKIVFVTGSSKGIGEAIVKEFASLKATVIIHYHMEEEKARLVEKDIVQKYQVPTLLVQGDISKEEDIDRMIKEIICKFGRIDVLVNNAAIAIDTLFEDKTVDNFQKILGINLIGTFLLSKKVGNIMMNQKSGRIINISSTNGIDTVYPESIDYDASKAGVISITKNLAKQFSPYVLVNSVAPGWVNTEMNKNLDKEFIEEECKKIVLNRFAEPEEIAGIVTFLASPKASYITGTTIRVDGGVN